MGSPADARIAFNASLTLSVVNLPETFEGFAVRKTIRMLEIHPRGRTVAEGVGEHRANRLVQAIYPLRRQRGSKLERINAGSEQRLSRVNIPEAKNFGLIEQERLQGALRAREEIFQVSRVELI